MLSTSNSSPRQIQDNIIIIIPTYNEGQNIEILIHDIERQPFILHSRSRILIVDDNSPDGTATKCEALNHTYNNITVLRREKKTGLGSAYRAGIRYALDTLNPSVIITMDADGSHSPQYLQGFIEEILGARNDVVIGSRKVEGGDIHEWSTYRHIVSLTANHIARWLCGFKVKDITSGYRAYRAEKLSNVIDRVTSTNFEFQIETLFYLYQTGARITEKPIVFKNRIFGKSKLTRNQIIQFLHLCFRLLLKRL